MSRFWKGLRLKLRHLGHSSFGIYKINTHTHTRTHHTKTREIFDNKKYFIILLIKYLNIELTVKEWAILCRCPISKLFHKTVHGKTFG